MNLALKYRPHNFGDVIGQDNIVTTITNQIENRDIKHGYLFTGPAGDGKTTTARILANTLNGSAKNVIEIDAASNNGVDNVRDIINNVQFKPIGTDYKIYIIDETHMLSIGAFNALLKTLEEPPEHAIFILCTTDPQKIPATILSRVQRFDFKRISVSDISNRLRYIAKREAMFSEGDIVTIAKDGLGNFHVGDRHKILNLESDEVTVSYPGIFDTPFATCGANNFLDLCDSKIRIADTVFDYIAKLANGGMRNAISMLDTCMGAVNGELTLSKVQDILGSTDYSILFKIATAILSKDEYGIVEIIENEYANGKDLKMLLKQLTDFFVEIRKYQIIGTTEYLTIPDLYSDELGKISSYEKSTLMEVLSRLLTLYSETKYEGDIKALLIGELLVISGGLK